MKSTLEPLEGNKIKLSVEVDDAEFAKDIDAAFRKLALEVRLPGFRPGKAPRKILEARIGLAPAREQALRDGIPQYLAKAVREHEVDLIASPDIEITGGGEEGLVTFDATCQVRPTVSVPGYAGLRIELPNPEPTDAEVQEAIDSERRRHGTLTVVERSAAKGDYVTMDLEAHRNGEPVPGLNTEDWLYEIGRGWVAEGFDDHLIGTTAGDSVSFTAMPSGTAEEADFGVKVGNVQELVLPEPTDEWVAENLPEHDSVEAWTQSVRTRLGAMRLNQGRQALIERATTALAALVDEAPPEGMVDQELQARVENFVKDLQTRGISVEQWMSATGQDTNTLIETFREQATKAVIVDLALRAVAEAEQVEVDESDIESEYARIAMRASMKAKDVRKAYEKNDAVFDLVAQLRKSKALDWLLHHIEIVDDAGTPLDRELVLGHTHDHDDDDDHEHAEEA
ncbi:MAG: trigger factor [Actinobacteria bacterium]|uniref:peptidylprolyl isomerase n=1 Tax=freshwater metagenome TaxID=449393 RepID=A0A6J7DFK0_9ZZZZ|nr:trigger factor [Actinomycetota bacterium]MSZ03434.1 trigger factor [Actinomycetota bacterium]MTB07997.1 trigger factor [Actinomycetota bacterium]